MQTEKAKALNDFLINLYSYFDKKLFLKTAFYTSYLSESKLTFSKTVLREYLNDFHEELKCNILEYRDIQIVNEYLQIYLKPCWSKVNELELVSNYEIIKNNIEVSYFLNLKKELVEKYNYIITLCNFNDSIFSHSNELFIYINDVYLQYDLDYYLKKSAEILDFPYERYKDKFNFSILLAECEKLETTQLKHRLVDERLTEFYQWQLQFDDYVYNEDYGSYRPLTTKHFSKFEDQCKLELNRLEKVQGFEDASLTNLQGANVRNASELVMYKWNSTDTDFLELFAALYQNESIVRADGKPLTRKEMLDYFQSILGLEIKDTEGKLTRAGNRNDNTVFLDTLAQEFRNYVAGKEKKLKSRK